MAIKYKDYDYGSGKSGKTPTVPVTTAGPMVTKNDLVTLDPTVKRATEKGVNSGVKKIVSGVMTATGTPEPPSSNSVRAAVDRAVNEAVDRIVSGVNKAKDAKPKPPDEDPTDTRTTGSSTKTTTPAAPKVTQQNVDNTAYAAALSAAEAARQGMPTYSGSFDDQIADLYAQINGRGDFSYDLNDDAFWQQYSDKYTQAAKNAMRDTMGQAAALTGGYGSSYGQAVGQQAYDRRMEELMDIAPELYQMAYQRYNDEGDRMLDQLNLARTMANDEYGRYVDDYNRWLTERDYADERADAAYKQQQNNLAFLQSMMALGYTPTAQEIADAGLNSGQYAAIAAQYAPKKKSGGSRSTPDTEDKDNGSGSKYTLDDLALAVSQVNHSNKKEDLVRAMAEEVKRGNTTFSMDDLNKFRSDNHI